MKNLASNDLAWLRALLSARPNPPGGVNERCIQWLTREIEKAHKREAKQ